ncbi:MAG: neutral zinc metallopeptidase [Gammaproteobacteria bacterium]|nr:neutral zinc metallopeptidase [Gammaproteobacteria bacterium]MBU1415877.1 neutral zinc metallopeptidase [Gammaproteobacteria bacterium]
MRLDNEQESANVEDRRGRGPMRAGSVGIGTIVLALVASYFFGLDPATVIGVATQMSGGGQVAQMPAGRPPAVDESARFVSKVLGSTERTWQAQFQRAGRQYVDPKLVLFSGATSTACGTGQSAMGPFYCPLDSKVYIDLVFFQEMKNRFRVSGDFAQAYVIAHEVGHHVQHLLGISDKVHAAQQAARNEAQANALSVQLELQADCLAGVWAAQANDARQILESGDVEEALAAASAIGDDRLQKQSRGYVVPDAFTHGTSAQRMHWFNRGIESGDMGQCNTFQSARL